MGRHPVSLGAITLTEETTMEMKHHKSSNTWSVGRVKRLTLTEATALLAKYKIAMEQLHEGETLVSY
tara:strand:- start:89 stop:289 length:201 start_codon:yes stop_codon:yes gene_type:complete